MSCGKRLDQIEELLGIAGPVQANPSPWNCLKEPRRSKALVGLLERGFQGEDFGQKRLLCNESSGTVLFFVTSRHSSCEFLSSRGTPNELSEFFPRTWKTLICRIWLTPCGKQRKQGERHTSGTQKASRAFWPPVGGGRNQQKAPSRGSWVNLLGALSR